MRRNDRLFAIIQVLRGRKQPVTAQRLADEFSVSLRTIYRDMAELSAQGVPVRGEAGTGYVIEASYELPPLMLTADEVEAAMLGLMWVFQRGDSALSHGARSLLEKLSQVIPRELRPLLFDASLRPALARTRFEDATDLGPIRTAIRERRKIEIAYQDANGKLTRRTLWPLLLAYMDEVRILVAHCEEREAFRHFRTDRLREVRVLDVKYPLSFAALRKRWAEQFPEREHGTLLR
ncbi:MAG TPA: YafY family protein [Polyangiaceae bacterium]|nr:YafY family protein [Polyangiaceae bacterium]